MPITDRTDDKNIYTTSGPNGSKVYSYEHHIFIVGQQKTIATAAMPPVARNFEIVVATDEANVANLKHAFQKDIAIALGLIAFALALGALAQAGIGLQPLTQLQSQLARIHNRAETRLTGTYPDEVAPLVGVVNQLLDRQDELVEKARGRAGDLAHGLKTPLTILALEADAIQTNGDPQAAQAVREQIGIMKTHIERELARARTHGLATTGGLTTDAHRSVARLIGLFDRMPDADRLTWRNDVPSNLRLNMDPDDFGEIMGNLLDNARKFAKSAIHIEASQIQSKWEVSVTDDGEGIANLGREQWLERGHTTSLPGEGAGLGLSIVHDILEEYQTQIQFNSTLINGTKISFTI